MLRATTDAIHTDGTARLDLCPSCDLEVAPDVATCPRCGGRTVSIVPASDPNLGRVLAGRYELRGVLGAGGMGTVYRAWQRTIGREVAVKLIHDGSRCDVTGIRRFLREARLASRLRHPGIVSIIDFGQTDDSDLFLVMELVQGRTLAEVMAAEPPFDVERTVRLGAQILDALAAAHRAGVVHRDLKPQNLMLLDLPSRPDVVKLLDFGVAKALGDDGASVTRSHHVVGTPYYMAPELATGEPASPASDLYAAGVVLCEAHLGRDLFASMSSADLRHEKAGLIALPADVDPRLRDVLGALVEPNPGRRPRTAAEARDRLQRSAGRGSATGARGSRRGWLAAGAGLTAVVAALGALVLREPPVASRGFDCGAARTAYLVLDGGVATGVRCVQALVDEDGGLALTWYGEGVRDRVGYRHLGEGRLGGAARAAELDGDAIAALTLGADTEGASRSLPRQITVGGAWAETWVRASDTGLAYASSLVEPARSCGAQLTRYRAYRPGDRGGTRVRCVWSGSQTWVGADRGVGDGAARVVVGSVDRLRARQLPGIGDGFDEPGEPAALWLPTAAGHAVRLHAIRVAEEGTGAAGPGVAEIAGWAARADQMLSASGVDVLFIADERGPDVETLPAATIGGPTRDVAGWAAHGNLVAEQRLAKIVVFFRAGAVDECAEQSSNDFVVMTPDGANTCGIPPEDLLGHLIWHHLGLRDTSDWRRPLTPTMEARLRRRLAGRGHE